MLARPSRSLAQIKGVPQQELGNERKNNCKNPDIFEVAIGLC
jgi:hypothetical protein